MNKIMKMPHYGHDLANKRWEIIIKNVWDKLNELVETHNKEPQEIKTLDLNGEFDAVVWAKEFMKLYNDKVKHQNPPDLNWVDEGLMIAWFSSAILTGYDYKTMKTLEGILKEYFGDYHDTAYKVAAKDIRSYYLGLLPEKELCDDCKAKNIGMFDGGYSDKQCPICRSKNEAIDEMKKRIEE